MTTVADFITNDPMNGKFRLRAGEAVAKDDLLLLNYKGLACKATNIINASVSSCTYGTTQSNEATGRIIAQTVLPGNTYAYARQAVVVDTEGSIFTLTAYSNSAGLYLSKYTSGGSLVGTALIEAVTTHYGHQILTLSNGNIICLAQASSSSIRFAIYDTSLTEVKAYTNLSNNIYGPRFSAVALSGGGVAIVYPDSASPQQTMLTTLSNSGDVVLSPTVLWLATGVIQSEPYYRIMQLSNGNIVIAVGCYYATDIGLWHGIFTVSGAPVLAFSQAKQNSSNSWAPDLSVIDGYYCISTATGTQQFAGVYNNSGVLQGAAFVATTDNGGTNFYTKIVNDGTDFWLIWRQNGTPYLAITKIPATGTNYLSTYTGSTSPDTCQDAIDAFCEHGVIIIVAANIGSQSKVLVFDTAARRMLGSPMYIGSTGSSGGPYPRILPFSDFSFVYMGSLTDSTGILVAGKYANAVIIGTAYESAAEGELVRVNGSAGAYVCNPMIGAVSKSFDHSASNIVGNKGTIMPNSVVLKGI